VGTISLVERDGLLVWEEGPPASAVRGRRHRAGGRPLAGTLVSTYGFQKVEPNQVIRLLEKLDDRLTPSPGLKHVRIQEDSQGVQCSTAEGVIPTEGRVLLFVHGTFSETRAIFTQLEATESGRRFLVAARDRYQAVLTFDHRTLSVSPMINAFDLQHAFAGSKADVDVVAHSRGGLVARWWLEGFGPVRATTARAVLVGSPLNGTGLAAPPRLRATMALLTNFGRAFVPYRSWAKRPPQSRSSRYRWCCSAWARRSPGSWARCQSSMPRSP
jgi:hypothetical protein